MGDKILIEKIVIIQNGLFQIDLKEIDSNKTNRVFVKPDILFKMIGEAMKLNHDAYIDRFFLKKKKTLNQGR